MNQIEQLIYNYIKNIKPSVGNLPGWINSDSNITDICLKLDITEINLNIALKNLVANHYLIEHDVCKTGGTTHTSIKKFIYKRFSV